MPSIEDVIHNELSGPSNTGWIKALQEAVPWILGEHALGLLDSEAVTTRADWNRLDDPLYRAQTVEQSPLLPERCAELLAVQVDQLRQAIINNGFGRQSGASINRRIASVTPALLRLPTSVAQLTVTPFAESWRFVADALARQVYATYRGQIPTAASEEWKLTNKLILVDFFRQCRLPEARLGSPRKQLLQMRL